MENAVVGYARVRSDHALKNLNPSEANGTPCSRCQIWVRIPQLRWVRILLRRQEARSNWKKMQD
eukprot:scaffold9918_cov153-Skeletonema_marinoi.AAC.2